MTGTMMVLAVFQDVQGSILLSLAQLLSTNFQIVLQNAGIQRFFIQKIAMTAQIMESDVPQAANPALLLGLPALGEMILPPLHVLQIAGMDEKFQEKTVMTGAMTILDAAQDAKLEAYLDIHAQEVISIQLLIVTQLAEMEYKLKMSTVTMVGMTMLAVQLIAKGFGIHTFAREKQANDLIVASQSAAMDEKQVMKDAMTGTDMTAKDAIPIVMEQNTITVQGNGTLAQEAT